MNYILLLLSIVLVNNVITSQFLGICPFLGVSKKVDTAAGMGAAVTFVLALASLITYFIQMILVKTGTEYLQTIAFILVIASIVQFVEMALKKMSPSLYQALGVYLPLITTNCAVLGIALVNVQKNYNILETLIIVISILFVQRSAALYHRAYLVLLLSMHFQQPFAMLSSFSDHYCPYP